MRITDHDCATAIDKITAWLTENHVWGAHLYTAECGPAVHFGFLNGSPPIHERTAVDAIAVFRARAVDEAALDAEYGPRTKR